jgi:hypothetical protein
MKQVAVTVQNWLKKSPALSFVFMVIEVHVILWMCWL